MIKNIRVTIEYDGTRFNGWQKQEGLLTVEGELEKAIKKATGESVKILASGRTDRGVHAYGQVANFEIDTTIPGDRFKYAVNDKLPDDISVISSEEVHTSFHARFSAKKKSYRYLVYSSETRSPIYRNYSYHTTYRLDLDRMKKASKYFVGRQDFSSFVPNKSNENKNIRTVYDLQLRQRGEFIEIEIEGNGFLHNMVRIIAGTLVEIGCGKREPKEAEAIIRAKDREQAGHTAPAQGLYLLKVFY